MISNRDGPSAHGKLLGKLLAAWAKAGEHHADQPMCSGCAYREGTLANMSAGTGSNAMNCALGVDPAPFGCHHGMKDGLPSKPCQGWLAAHGYLAGLPINEVSPGLEQLAKDVQACEGQPDQVRADYERWAAEHDPDGRMNDYERARIFNRPLSG